MVSPCPLQQKLLPPLLCRLRSFWPFSRCQTAQLLLKLAILFLLCANHTILRNLKDPLVMTASFSGAEVIPFLKVWGMLPAAFLATSCYARLANRYSSATVFHLIVTTFLLYFLLFAFFLYPHRQQLHLLQLGHSLRAALPAGLHGLVAMLTNWSCTLFYLAAELWSIVVLSVLFWGFVNDHMPLELAKRLYGILNIGSTLAPICSGLLIVPFLRRPNLCWEQTVRQMILLVTLLGLLAMLLFHLLQRYSRPHHHAARPVHLSLRQSLQAIAASPYLLALATTVISYNVVINCTDVLWKKQLQSFFVTPSKIFAHTSQISMWTGVIATIGSLLFSCTLQRLGWTGMALCTPLLMLLLVVPFFTLYLGASSLAPLTRAALGTTPLALTVYLGALQNCLGKAAKYSIFDVCKELAFVSLPAATRKQGKAAVDGLGTEIGKSTAALLCQGALLFFGSISQAAPLFAIALLLVFIAWFAATFAMTDKSSLALES